jgi:hypothetical protein
MLKEAGVGAVYMVATSSAVLTVSGAVLLTTDELVTTGLPAMVNRGNRSTGTLSSPPTRFTSG